MPERHNSQRLLNEHWLQLATASVLVVSSLLGIVLWQMQSISVQRVHNTTMAPLLHNGDAVVASSGGSNKVAPGDIIAYRNPLNPEVIVAERLVSIDMSHGLFVAKGDSESVAHKPFDTSLVIGKVNHHIVKFGYVLDFLRSRTGLLLGIYAPAMVIIYFELKRLIGYYGQSAYRLSGHSR